MCKRLRALVRIVHIKKRKTGTWDRERETENSFFFSSFLFRISSVFLWLSRKKNNSNRLTRQKGRNVYIRTYRIKQNLCICVNIINLRYLTFIHLLSIVYVRTANHTTLNCMIFWYLSERRVATKKSINSKEATKKTIQCPI